jgi:polyisoprenoid-binding protein YceI
MEDAMRVLIVALALALSTVATAQTVPSLTPSASASLNPADAPAGTYELDPRHASVLWRVRHTEIGTYVGRFDNATATLQFDPQNPLNSSFTATVQAGSVSTGLRNRNGELAFDGDIANVLGAPANADISFTSETLTQNGPHSVIANGQLTLNGQTHPAAFEITFQGGRFVQLRNKHVLAFSARALINRQDWGVGSLIFNQFAGDEVEILVEGEFVKAGD